MIGYKCVIYSGNKSKLGVFIFHNKSFILLNNIVELFEYFLNQIIIIKLL